MSSRLAAAAAIAAISVVPMAAQKKPAPKPTVYDLTVNADGAAHTGTMTLTVTGAKVSGEMHITAPSEITGKGDGTTKAQAMKLDFAYRMVQRGCDGRIVMDLTSAKKGGPATGKAEITGCGRTDANKLLGTVELRAKK